MRRQLNMRREPKRRGAAPVSHGLDEVLPPWLLGAVAGQQHGDRAHSAVATHEPSALDPWPDAVPWRVTPDVAEPVAPQTVIGQREEAPCAVGFVAGSHVEVKAVNPSTSAAPFERLASGVALILRISSAARQRLGEKVSRAVGGG